MAPSRDGCVWPSSKLLRMTHEQGIHLMRVGATKEEAFSIFVHAVNVIWNRANYNSDSTRAHITLPSGFEGIYGIMTANILSHLKQTGTGGRPANLAGILRTRLQVLTETAAALDASTEYSASIFPTSNDVRHAAQAKDQFLRSACSPVNLRLHCLRPSFHAFRQQKQTRLGENTGTASFARNQRSSGRKTLPQARCPWSPNSNTAVQIYARATSYTAEQSPEARR